MPNATPSITVKDAPKEVYDIICDKQTAEKKKKNRTVSLSQAIIMLIKEAYCKGEKK